MSASKKKGLGRGLDALLSASNKGDDVSPLSGKGSQSLPLKLLQAGKYQPRTIMADEPLKELADSIRERGVMQPLLVREIDNGRYEIIAGRSSSACGSTFAHHIQMIRPSRGFAKRFWLTRIMGTGNTTMNSN